MRNTFVTALHELMGQNEKVWLLTGDLGFGMFEQIERTYEDRFINAGIAEQNMIGMAAGMASCGLIPFVYSITPFLLYRGFEFIRNEVDHDNHNVKLVGGGRGRDYDYLGFTHWCEDDKKLMDCFPNIYAMWPYSRDEVAPMVTMMAEHNGPCYLNLSRGG